jgi:hypothetical protein
MPKNLKFPKQFAQVKPGLPDRLDDFTGRETCQLLPFMGCFKFVLIMKVNRYFVKTRPA